MTTLRVLTVTDLHQSKSLCGALHAAVLQHRPDVVAFVGDVLDFSGRSGSQFSTPECAEFLAALPVEQRVFTRGNHDGEDWQLFAYAWPHERKPLLALHGTAHAFGPLVVVGFPCHTGWDGPWRETLPKTGNVLSLDHTQWGRKALPENPTRWLRPLLRQHGPAARTLWLLHEPPMAQPIAHPMTGNREWRELVERHQPLLTVSGHDHDTPRQSGLAHARLGQTVCVNVGQSVEALHYCVIELTFPSATPSLPLHVVVECFPSGQSLEIQP